MRSLPASLAALAALALAGAAHAQPSTDGLATAATRSWRAEVAVGASVLPVRDVVGLTPSSAPEPYAALASLRWAPEERGGVRATGWWLHGSTTIQVQDGSGGVSEEEVERNILALAGTLEGTWRVGRRSTLSLAMGAGLASARGSYVDWADGTPGGRTRSASETGRLIAGGLALRVGSLVVEQHALILHGAERAVPEERELFPLTVGWRF